MYKYINIYELIIGRKNCKHKNEFNFLRGIFFSPNKHMLQVKAGVQHNFDAIFVELGTVGKEGGVCYA